MSIITLTINPALDKSSTVKEMVAADKMECSKPVFEAGGGGINVSRVIHRLGGRSTAIFQSSGPSGSYIEQALLAEGLNIETFTTKEWTRENFIVTDESTQKQYRFGMPGPSISKVELENCLSILKKQSSTSKFLVLSGSLPPNVSTDFYASLCSWAKDNGLKIILDTKGKALIEALKVGIHLVKPNLKELGELVGEQNINLKRAREIAMGIINNNQAEMVVVSLGEKGAMMVTKHGVETIASPKVEVKSAVGAGDSMVAGLVYSLQKELSSNEVLKFGIACGTAATLTAGSELCRTADVLRINESIDA